jgi:hypothetical protein
MRHVRDVLRLKAAEYQGPSGILCGVGMIGAKEPDDGARQEPRVSDAVLDQRPPGLTREPRWSPKGF